MKISQQSIFFRYYTALLCFLLPLFRLSAAELTILQTTDLHGTENTAELLDIIKQERHSDPELLLIDCGDLTQGTESAARNHGLNMIGFLNQAEYDIFVPGNHDFDYGADVFLKNMKNLTGTQVLAGNLKNGNQYFYAWKLFERKNLRIAVIGIVPPYLDQWMGSVQLQKFTTELPEQTLLRIMPEIRKAKPDLIILAIHLGRYTSKRLTPDGKTVRLSHLLRKFPEISLVLGGHTHETVPGVRLYPDFWYVQAPFQGKGLVRITVKTDSKTAKKRTVKTEISSHLLCTGKKDDENDSCTDGLSGKTLVQFFADAVRKKTAADCVLINTFNSKTLPVPRTNQTEKDLFRVIPFENTVTVLHVTERELAEITAEQDAQNENRNRQYLFRYKTADSAKNTISLAVTSYAAAGAGGRYPRLREIASSAANRTDLPLTVRDAVREKYLSLPAADK